MVLRNALVDLITVRRVDWTALRRAGRIIANLLAATMCGVAALTALILIYSLVSPAGVRARANAELELQGEIADENKAFCESFGMPPATPDHNRCVMKLNEIRAKQQQRFADTLTFL